MQVLSTQYMPSIYWMVLFIHGDVTVDVQEHYQKMSLRNRTEIATPNGVLKLSVPLKHGRNQRRAVRDVIVHNEENWQNLHYKSIANAYRKSPYFELLENELIEFYEKKFEKLLDVNNASLQMLCSLLGVKSKVNFTAEYQPKNLSYKNLINLSATKGVEPIRFPEYQQVFMDRQPFHPNLSTLDLIYCLGPQEALQYLKEVYDSLLKSLFLT